MFKRSLSLLLYFILLFSVVEMTSRAVLFRSVENDSFVGSSSLWRIKWLRKNYEVLNSYYKYDASKGWDTVSGFKGSGHFEKGKFNVSINAKGLRSLREHTYSSPAGRKRFLILGNSTVFGEDNADEDIFPEVLDKMFPDIDVLNFGVGGYGFGQMLIKFKEEGLKYSPDIVLFYYTIADVERSRLNFRDFAKPQFLIRKNTLIIKNEVVDTPEMIRDNEKQNLYFFDFLKVCLHVITEHTGYNERKDGEVNQAILEEFSEICKRSGIQFIVVNDKMDYEFLESKGIKYINLETKTTGDFHGHWNAKGHNIVANQIYKGLKNMGILYTH